MAQCRIIIQWDGMIVVDLFKEFNTELEALKDLREVITKTIDRIECGV